MPTVGAAQALLDELEAWNLGEVQPVHARAALAAVRAYCRWSIGPVAPVVDARHDLEPSGVLLLPTLRLVSVEALNVSGYGDVAEPVWSDAGIVNVPRGRSLFRGVTVSYTHGYDVIPDDVIGVALAFAGRAAAHPSGQRDSTVGPFRDTYTGQGGLLTKDEKHHLDLYRIQD